MGENSLENSKIIVPAAAHLQIVQTPSGIKRVLKYPRENYNYQQRLRELIQETTIQDLLAYAGIANPSVLRFHDLRIGLERDELEYSWGFLDENPNITILNADQFPIAFVIDWFTGQRDRGIGNKENTRLQKLENGNYLFIPTDNGEALLGVDGQLNPESNSDFAYTSSLLFSTKINNRQELENAINEFKKWPLYKIIVFDVLKKFLELGSTFSQEGKDSIIESCDKILHFIEHRKNISDRILSWYDQAHQQPEMEKNQSVAVN